MSVFTGDTPAGLCGWSSKVFFLSQAALVQHSKCFALCFCFCFFNFMGSIKLKVVYRVASLVIFFSHSQATGGRELI